MAEEVDVRFLLFILFVDLFFEIASLYIATGNLKLTDICLC